DAVFFAQLQKPGKGITVNAQLIKVSDGSSLWSRSFEGDPRNTFGLQDAVAKAVTHLLAPNSNTAEKQPVRETTSVDAYEACETGRFFLSKRTAEAVHLSVGYFERSITEDQNYALAYAGLAEAYAYDIQNWRNSEA